MLTLCKLDVNRNGDATWDGSGSNCRVIVIAKNIETPDYAGFSSHFRPESRVITSVSLPKSQRGAAPV